jgi:hypothetical protein
VGWGGLFLERKSPSPKPRYARLPPSRKELQSAARGSEGPKALWRATGTARAKQWRPRGVARSCAPHLRGGWGVWAANGRVRAVRLGPGSRSRPRLRRDLGAHRELPRPSPAAVRAPLAPRRGGSGGPYPPERGIFTCVRPQAIRVVLRPISRIPHSEISAGAPWTEW